MGLDRRQLLVSGAATGVAALPLPTAAAVPDLAAIDHDRILRQARAALARDVVTLSAFPARRSPGGPNDYYSEGDYWWPDPAHPGGPYIRRDGLSNPDKFDDHRLALIRLSLDMPALTAAWRLTGDAVFGQKAAAHLRAWFVTPATRMTPNLEHAQAIIGVNTGRGIGIIDTLHLVEVARAFERLGKADENLFPAADRAAVTQWFDAYFTWLTSSANGLDEKSQANNHGTAWWLQATMFARVSGHTAFAVDAAQAMRETIIPKQVAPDGSLPLELARTKPYAYCLFDLEVMTALCHLLAEAGRSVWRFETADGRGVARAEAFMFPYIKDKARWPFPRDVEYFDAFPIRQASLLFCGVALDRPDYLALWRSLPSDSEVPEVIRNFPIRQPVLWF